MNSQPATAAVPVSVAEPVALVLSRQARPGHELGFEEVLHTLAGAVRGQPGHLDVTVPRLWAPRCQLWPGYSGRRFAGKLGSRGTALITLYWS
jgi:hypothetical protein